MDRRRLRRGRSRWTHEPELDEVTQAIELAFLDGPADEVVFCGFGEPTMRLDVVLAVTEWLRLRRIRSRAWTPTATASCSTRMSDVPAALAAAGLDAVTVSLNAADPESYDRVCRPDVLQVLQGRPAFRRTVSCAWHRDHADRRRLPGRRPAPACADLAAAMGAGFRARGYAAPRARDSCREGRP